MAWSNRRFYDGDCKESFFTLKTFYLAIPCYSEIPPIWRHLIPRGLSYLAPPSYLETPHNCGPRIPGSPTYLGALIPGDPPYLDTPHTLGPNKLGDPTYTFMPVFKYLALVHITTSLPGFLGSASINLGLF